MDLLPIGSTDMLENISVRPYNRKQFIIHIYMTINASNMSNVWLYQKSIVSCFGDRLIVHPLWVQHKVIQDNLLKSTLAYSLIINVLFMLHDGAPCGASIPQWIPPRGVLSQTQQLVNPSLSIVFLLADS